MSVKVIPQRWPVSSSELELLRFLSEHRFSNKVAAVLGVHESVVSKRLNALSLRVGVVAKAGARWHLTERGEQLVSWYRDAENKMMEILSKEPPIRIATTREFSARVLCPNLGRLVNSAPGKVVDLISSDSIEEVILTGAADIGIDCGRPWNPSIRFRRLIDERFEVIAAPRFLRRHRVRHAADLEGLPFVESPRLLIHRVLERSEPMEGRLTLVSDLASTREVCVGGIAWSVLPRYAVARELAQGSLNALAGWNIPKDQFGIWWRGERQSLEPWVHFLSSWLFQQHT